MSHILLRAIYCNMTQFNDVMYCSIDGARLERILLVDQIFGDAIPCIARILPRSIAAACYFCYNYKEPVNGWGQEPIYNLYPKP